MQYGSNIIWIKIHMDQAQIGHKRYGQSHYGSNNTGLTQYGSSTMWVKSAAAETWRRVWGDEKIFRGPKFLNDVFWEKNVHVHVQNFSCPFFSHRPRFFLILTLSSDSP